MKVNYNDLRKILNVKNNQLNELQSRVKSLELKAVPTTLDKDENSEVDQLKV